MNKLKITFDDGSLTLDENNCFCVIGETAHKYYFKILTQARTSGDVRKIMIDTFFNLATSI